MEMLPSIVKVSALFVALLACIFDLRQHRIPNWLTFGAAAAALVYNLTVSGPIGFVSSFGGWFLGAAIFFPPFMVGGLGAGDVKLIAALGAWLGWHDALWLGLYIGACGGVLALIAALFRG